MAVLTSVIITVVATASQRSTRAGATCRSAMAPKISGEMNAASAVAAKANGLMPCIPSRDHIVRCAVYQHMAHMLWMRQHEKIAAQFIGVDAKGIAVYSEQGRELGEGVLCLPDIDVRHARRWTENVGGHGQHYIWRR